MKDGPARYKKYRNSDDQALFKRRAFGIGFRPANRKGVTASLSFGVALIIVVNTFNVIPAIAICLALTALFYAWAIGKLI